jgi:phosphoenolpyruvate carboxylase
MQYCSEELEAHAPNAREPYREVLKKLEHRLQATIDWTGQAVLTHTKVWATLPPADAILSTKELLEPLLLIHESLDTTGLHAVADGELTDVIRRVAAFGVALMPLDIRQESGRHTEALDAITRYLGIGSYAQWDEMTRRNWLQNELASRRPLMPRGIDFKKIGFSSTVIDTLRTFEVAASIQEESLGAYVISQCQQASDVLAVALLQQDAGLNPPMRVVPLFETLDDLQRAPATVDALFSFPAYKGRINNKQEIMVGYSDSAKDAGRIAASWEQYNSQMAMSEIALKHGIEVTFFHGKGGTVGRGGNPALYKAILAHPPGTINGRFRVTEQGEMITQNLGQISVAERTLDLMTAGVLSERFIPRPAVKAEWKETMERLSDVSCKVYRGIVREEPRFVPYFRAATPELELSGLNVGSRPTKRNPKGGVESLRAIPWNFAWTQTRLNLPTWLGIGEAFMAEMHRNPHTLKDMCAQWPWFQTLVDLVEMILVKSDLKIAENYDSQLVRDPESIALGKELRQKMALTIKSVLEVSGNSKLQVNNSVLLRSLNVRNPYIDPLNVIQVEILRRLRTDEHLSEEDRGILQDALLITINGIANGMKNSG